MLHATTIDYNGEYWIHKSGRFWAASELMKFTVCMLEENTKFANKVAFTAPTRMTLMGDKEKGTPSNFVNHLTFIEFLYT